MLRILTLFVVRKDHRLHADTTAYADFDFRHPEFHELQFWAIPARLELFGAQTFVALVERISTRFGRQPLLPDWVYQGAILGLKNGPAHAERILKVVVADTRGCKLEMVRVRSDPR